MKFKLGDQVYSLWERGRHGKIIVIPDERGIAVVEWDDDIWSVSDSDDVALLGPDLDWDHEVKAEAQAVYNKAWADYDKAWADIHLACAVYDKACTDYDKACAELDKARADYEREVKDDRA